MKLFQSIVLGFATSALLYEPLHREEIPELARYAVGGVLVVKVTDLIFDDEHLTAKIFIAFCATALGVGLNRLRMQVSRGCVE